MIFCPLQLFYQAFDFSSRGRSELPNEWRHLFIGSPHPKFRIGKVAHFPLNSQTFDEGFEVRHLKHHDTPVRSPPVWKAALTFGALDVVPVDLQSEDVWAGRLIRREPSSSMASPLTPLSHPLGGSATPAGRCSRSAVCSIWR